jgi:hypothetical protein
MSRVSYRQRTVTSLLRTCVPIGAGVCLLVNSVSAQVRPTGAVVRTVPSSPTVSPGTSAAPATAPQPARAASGPPQVLTLRFKGTISADTENVNNEPDPHQSIPTVHSLQVAPRGSSRTMRLKDSPDAARYFDALKHDLGQFGMHVALLGGHKYMINSCLGVKASAGEFDLSVPTPDIRVENTGIVMTYAISHVGLNLLRVRLRPDLGDLVQPCHFSGRIGIGGYADNVRYELHLDPILDLEQCKIGSLGQVQEVWRVGQFRLEPLPPEVGNLAKDMVEDALTYASNFNVVDRVVASLTGALGAQCHK